MFIQSSNAILHAFLKYAYLVSLKYDECKCNIYVITVQLHIFNKRKNKCWQSNKKLVE